ncbi:MAG: hypothetical protein LBR20_05700 [Propionibacteriaceae bacterium]|jgi:hypothetical protein|nr:hypothetical protein [Propionibacteriaceae bacterium]
MSIGVRGRNRARALLATGLLAAAFVAVTFGAYVDVYQVRIGTQVGGAYDIALMDDNGNIYQANPAPLGYNHAGTYVPQVGQWAEPVISIKVVTLSEVTGPIRLTITDNNPAPSNSDPIYYTLFTVSVDGVLVADHVDMHQVQMLEFNDWTPNQPKQFDIALSLQTYIADPQVLGRALFLALIFSGESQ